MNTPPTISAEGNTAPVVDVMQPFRDALARDALAGLAAIGSNASVGYVNPAAYQEYLDGQSDK